MSEPAEDPRATPAAGEMLSEMKRLLDAIPQPAVLCHPDDRGRLDAALARLPWNLPRPELRTSPYVRPGEAIYIADTRIVGRLIEQNLEVSPCRPQ